MPRFQRPTGTHDILPEEQPYWEYVTEFAVRLARQAGFERIDVPIFEATELFARASAPPPTWWRRKCTPSPTRAGSR